MEPRLTLAVIAAQMMERARQPKAADPARKKARKEKRTAHQVGIKRSVWTGR